MEKICVGSRQSQLALIQTQFVIDQLKDVCACPEFEIIKMNTTGDNILDKALSKIGEKSLFTKELEIAIENREVHFAVHSLKDLPTTLPPGMAIGCILKREDPYDAVVMHPKYRDKDLGQLPPDSVIGTSSLRRIAQLKRKYSHLTFETVRGNLNTRLRKLDEGSTYAALILAVAGLKRLGLENRISFVLTPDVCLNAVGQGALAVEMLSTNRKMLEIMKLISDDATTLCCVAERAFMKKLEGGCSVPLGVHSTLTDNRLVLRGGVFSLDGKQYIEESIEVDLSKFQVKNVSEETAVPREYTGVVSLSISNDLLEAAFQCGCDLAEKLLGKGAKQILNEVREINEKEN